MNPRPITKIRAITPIGYSFFKSTIILSARPHRKRSCQITSTCFRTSTSERTGTKDAPVLSQKSLQNSPPGIPAVTRRFAGTEPPRRNFPLLVYHHIMSHAQIQFFVAPGRSSRPDLCFGLNQTNLRLSSACAYKPPAGCPPERSEQGRRT